MNKVFYLLLVSLWSACLCQQLNTSLFKAHLSDGWYPHDSKKLLNLIKSLETQAKEQFDMVADGNKLRALIVPHAGYTYSGAIAVAAYRLCTKNFFDRIIILVPSHTAMFHGIAVPSFTTYRIPTGSLRVGTTCVNKLLTDSLCIQNDEFFMSEHALEIQLPLIHYYQPHAQIVPLIVGSVEEQDLDRIAQKIGSIVTPKTLVVVSSDLTHYGVHFNYVPFTDLVDVRLRQLDSSILWPLQHNDIDQFKSVMAVTNATVCGQKPIEILMKLVKNNVFKDVDVRLVGYGNSNAVSHDDSRVVSYASLIVTQEKLPMLNTYEKRSLLRMARDILAASFDAQSDDALLMPILTPAITRKARIFVTLYAHDGAKKNLRGCIGTSDAYKPIYKAVAEMVLAAAHDSRFDAVKKSELNVLSIEISVLTEPVPVKSYRDIVLHKHGIILSFGSAKALFLPKVPQEHGFDLETTLQHLSEKAGLDINAWRLPEATFQVFEAIDFSDEK